MDGFRPHEFEDYRILKDLLQQFTSGGDLNKVLRMRLIYLCISHVQKMELLRPSRKNGPVKLGMCLKVSFQHQDKMLFLMHAPRLLRS